jgi:hypothetical protein
MSCTSDLFYLTETTEVSDDYNAGVLQGTQVMIRLCFFIFYLNINLHIILNVRSMLICIIWHLKNYIRIKKN